MNDWFDAGYQSDGNAFAETGAANPDYFNFNTLAGMYSPEDVGFNGSFQLGNGDGYGVGQDASPGTSRTNPEFQKYLSDKNLSFKGNILGNSYLSGLFKGDKQIGQKVGIWGGDDTAFGALTGLASAALTGGAFGPGFAAGMTGAGAGALGGATGGLMSSLGNGTDVGRGILAGGLGGGLGGLNPAGYLGVDNALAKGAINGAVGGGVSQAAAGGDIGKGVVSGGLTGGLNSMGKLLPDFMGNIFGGDELANLPGNMVTSGFEGTASPDSYSDEGGKFGTYSGVNNQQQFTPQTTQPDEAPQKSILSSIFGNAPSANAIGTWAGNHGGDLASMAYGLYTQNKQKNQMNQMMQGLQGLYSPNGAYATQLRNTLMAKDAMSGRRSNYAGRETQLMADLAGHNAALMPGMLNMQNGMNNNSNRQLDILMQGMNKLGGWNGLKSLFSPTAVDGFNYNNLPGQ